MKKLFLCLILAVFCSQIQAVSKNYTTATAVQYDFIGESVAIGSSITKTFYNAVDYNGLDFNIASSSSGNITTANVIWKLTDGSTLTTETLTSGTPITKMKSSVVTIVINNPVSAVITITGNIVIRANNSAKQGDAFDASNVAITGGSINGTTIGQTLSSSGSFTTLSASSVSISGTLQADSGITSNGHIIPDIDNTYDLGSSANRWRDLYVSTASIHIGESGNEGIISYDPLLKQLNISGTINMQDVVVDGSFTGVTASIISSTANYATTANFANSIADGIVTNQKLITGNFTAITGVGTLSTLTINGTVSGITQLSAQTATLSGVVTASAFVGNGSALTNLSQNNLPTTSVSTNFTGIVTLNSLLIASGGVTSSGTVSANMFAGSGASLTNIPLSALPATIVTNNYASSVSLNSNLYVSGQSNFSGILTSSQVTVSGTVTANKFYAINGITASTATISGTVSTNTLYSENVIGGAFYFSGTTPTPSVIGLEYFVQKTTTESITSSTTTQNDDELFFPIGTGQTWWVDAVIIATAAGGVPNIKCGIISPANSITKMFFQSNGSGASDSTVTGALLNSGETLNFPIASGQTNKYVHFHGFVTTTTTSGTIYFSWAQQNSNANATSVLPGSFISARRVR